MISACDINATVWQTHLALNLRWEYGPYHIYIEIYGFQFRTPGLPTVHSVLRWVESATGESPKKRGSGNKARYILHAYRKCGGARQDERVPGWGKGKAGAGTHGRLRDRIRTSWEWSVAWEGTKTGWPGRVPRVSPSSCDTLPFLPPGIYVNRSEPDVIWLHSRPCPGISPVLWSPRDYDAMQCIDRAHEKKERKKKWFAAVKRESDTASQNTALWLRMYYRRTVVGCRWFYITFGIGIN